MFGMVPGLREAGALISGKLQQLAQPMVGANVSPLRRNLPWMNFIHENPNPHMDIECSCHRSLCGKMLMQYFIQIQIFLTPTHFQEWPPISRNAPVTEDAAAWTPPPPLAAASPACVLLGQVDLGDATASLTVTSFCLSL